MEKKRVLVQDIADSLNLSRTTVSKVLNGNAGVSAKTRDRILKKAELSITPLKVATAMFNAYVGLAADEVDGVKQCLDNGYESLEAIYDDMKTNNWTKVKMDIPWLEFVDEGLRAVQGNCLVSQYYKNGAWHDLNKLYT